MQTILGNLSWWALPPGVREALSFIRSSLYLRLACRKKCILMRNKKFQNLHTGRRCFIIASGPSLAKQNIACLKEELCITVSNAFVHPAYQEIRPIYHCVAGYHFPITEEAFRDWLVEIEKATRNATVFFSLDDVQRIQKNNIFENNGYFLDYSGTAMFVRKCGINLMRPILAPQSVTVIALQLAIAMNCNPIYLLGCDHDWILNVGQSRHFYDESEHVFWKHNVSEWKGLKYIDEFRNCYKLWQQYEQLKAIAEKRNCQIYNATEGGILDVFPKVQLAKVFPDKK